MPTGINCKSYKLVDHHDDFYSFFLIYFPTTDKYEANNRGARIYPCETPLMIGSGLGKLRLYFTAGTGY